MKLHPHDQAMLIALSVLFFGAIGYGMANDGLALPLGIGLLLLVLSGLVANAGQGGTASVIGLPVLGMAMVGLLIHAARGHAEAHFAVFSFLACTVIYRRVAAVLAAAGAIALHHLSFNYFQAWGWGPVCFTQTGLPKVIEHAAYVVAEAVLLAFIARRGAQEGRGADEVVRIADGLIGDHGQVTFDVIHERYQGRSARRLVQALREIEDVVTGLRETSTALQGAARTVAEGSGQLARRTDEAAASLQQTSSALEEFTGGARLTSQSASSADEVARQASALAQDGGEAVSRAVATMAEIQRASHRIADIIGTIDGIAFQTNILALNAAVEAARAGEQGRGFAVVASEVRSLAQRSAHAAREIKGLIQRSVETVETGTAQVSGAGERMDRMVGSVQKVCDLIGEISTAAREQSQGIDEVHGAIANLDRVTQQNATLVEESATAADVLRRQSDRLDALIARFQPTGA